MVLHSLSFLFSFLNGFKWSRGRVPSAISSGADLGGMRPPPNQANSNGGANHELPHGNVSSVPGGSRVLESPAATPQNSSPVLDSKKLSAPSVSSSSASPQAPQSKDHPISSPLLSLPGEIIHLILGHLDQLSLVETSLTCRQLHPYVENDVLWSKLVKESLPIHQKTPSPCKTWKELYICHYPYWFLPKHKIWFSDKAHAEGNLIGQLILARYDYRTGNIEAYKLVAEHRTRSSEAWEWNPAVVIHNFDPKVQLFLDDPVIKLVPGSHLTGVGGGSRLKREVSMQRDIHQPIKSALSLTQPINPEWLSPRTDLWPPIIVPAKNRVPTGSTTMYRSDADKPQHYARMSDTTFRLRKWIEYGGRVAPGSGRIGEVVMTFSTLPEDVHRPTKERPFQGIWVGDYAGHGCEFLVVIQKELSDPSITRLAGQPVPRHSTTRSNAITSGEDSLIGGADLSGQELEEGEGAEGQAGDDEDPLGYTGRLEAIKLTGDSNVRRGEYTWIAEDIGRGGLIRIAEEQRFRGARIVGSWGHVASRGFMNDSYMSSQLIMISPDCLAQYWEDFGNISFYYRVNIHDFLSVDSP